MLLFEWDSGNIDHLTVHDITPREAEEVINNEPLDLDAQIRGNEERFTQVGETAEGRILIVITTWRGEKLRVVTAYPAKTRFRKIYLAHKGMDS